MKGLQVTKIVKEIKFEGFWGEKNLIFDFQEIFATINKMFILAGRLCTRLSFYEV